jgi:hypothetical protein
MRRNELRPERLLQRRIREGRAPLRGQRRGLAQCEQRPMPCRARDRGVGPFLEHPAAPLRLWRLSAGRVRGRLPSAPIGDHRVRLKPNRPSLHETQGGSADAAALPVAHAQDDVPMARARLWPAYGFVRRRTDLSTLAGAGPVRGSVGLTWRTGGRLRAPPSDDGAVSGSAVRPSHSPPSGVPTGAASVAGLAAHCLTSAMAEESTTSPRLPAPADPSDLVPSVRRRPR